MKENSLFKNSILYFVQFLFMFAFPFFLFLPILNPDLTKNNNITEESSQNTEVSYNINKDTNINKENDVVKNISTKTESTITTNRAIVNEKYVTTFSLKDPYVIKYIYGLDFDKTPQKYYCIDARTKKSDSSLQNDKYETLKIPSYDIEFVYTDSEYILVKNETKHHPYIMYIPKNSEFREEK